MFSLCHCLLHNTFFAMINFEKIIITMLLHVCLSPGVIMKLTKVNIQKHALKLNKCEMSKKNNRKMLLL